MTREPIPDIIADCMLKGCQMGELRAEIARLTNLVHDLWEVQEAGKIVFAEKEKTQAEIERLKAVLQQFLKQPWKSIDKDNMEYQVTVSCYMRDALRAALEPKP